MRKSCRNFHCLCWKHAADIGRYWLKISIPIPELLKKYQCRYYTDTNTQKNTDTQPLSLQYFRRWFPTAPSSFLLALTYAWTKSRISLLSIEKRHLKHSLTMIARDTCASSGMLFFVPLCSAVFRCSRFSKLEFVRLIFFWALIRLFLPSLLLCEQAYHSSPCVALRLYRFAGVFFWYFLIFFRLIVLHI